MLRVLPLALLIATPAAAAPFSADEAQALRTLLVKDEIRDALAHYNQLVDRDDGAPDRKAWGDAFTEDAVMEARWPDGKLDLRLEGRAAIMAKFGGGEEAPGGPSGLSSKHYIVNTVFDEVAPARVRVHVNALSLTATRNLVDRHCAGCGGVPVQASLFVYDEVWVKGPAGWRISVMKVQFRN